MNPDEFGKITTPNVIPGDSSARYKLYRHGPQLFSISPEGDKFSANVYPDECGSPGCQCAAFLIPLTTRGMELLRQAQQLGLT